MPNDDAPAKGVSESKKELMKKRQSKLMAKMKKKATKFLDHKAPTKTVAPEEESKDETAG